MNKEFFIEMFVRLQAPTSFDMPWMDRYQVGVVSHKKKKGVQKLNKYYWKYVMINNQALYAAKRTGNMIVKRQIREALISSVDRALRDEFMKQIKIRKIKLKE